MSAAAKPARNNSDPQPKAKLADRVPFTPSVSRTSEADAEIQWMNKLYAILYCEE